MARLALVLGKLFDRGQRSCEESVSRTLQLDEELTDMLKDAPESCWHASNQDDREMTGKCFEVTMLQFLHQVVLSSKILQSILGNWSEGPGSSSDCRGSSGPLGISLPYFGSITICPGKVLAERLRRETLGNAPMPQYREQQQQQHSQNVPYSATTNGLNGGESQRTQVEQTSTELHQSGYLDNQRMWLEDEMPSSTVAEWELGAFFDDIGHGLWSSLEFDQNLDRSRGNDTFFQ
ncbi:hypothetical protein BJX62DRAFT_241177 [Aspergillus germanicus]